MNLPARVRTIRKQRGMTQEVLARKAGLSLGYLARLEIGRHEPSVRTVMRLAKALKVKVGELLK